MQVNLLSSFRLLVDGTAVEVPPSSQRLLAYLALCERPQSRMTVAASLWLDAADHRAMANLRSAIWKLHDVRPRVIVDHASYLGLGAEVTVDVAGMVRAARQVLDGASDDVPWSADRPAHLHVLSADLLPDWDDEWIVFERERLRQLRVHAIEALSRRLRLCARHAEAVEAGMVAVACDPLRESAQRVLIEAHLAEGNVADARRQFEAFRELLQRSLGIAPSDGLSRMVGVRPAGGLVNG